MGKVIQLRPFLPPLPDKLPERTQVKPSLLTIVRPICEKLYGTEDFTPLIEGVNKETSVNGKISFDQCKLAELVVATAHADGNTLLDEPNYKLGEIADAISRWMKQREITRRARRLAAREAALLQLQAAE